jgi:hypothetical protein
MAFFTLQHSTNTTQDTDHISSDLIPCGGGVECHYRNPASRRRQRKGKSGMRDRSSRQRERPTTTNPQLSNSNKTLVVSPRWVLYSRTDWPPDRRS